MYRQSLLNPVQRFWIAVASADHARKGRAAGFMQVNHGKAGPLRRLKADDGIVYYSPVTQMGGKDRLQSFTTLGYVRDDRVYQVEMAPGFTPFRRDVAYLPAQSASIQPLLDILEFTQGKSSWGYSFRFGLLEISPDDFLTIASAMGVTNAVAIDSTPVSLV
jgi:hypothetical protein